MRMLITFFSLILISGCAGNAPPPSTVNPVNTVARVRPIIPATPIIPVTTVNAVTAVGPVAPVAAVPSVTSAVRPYVSTSGFACPPTGTTWIVNDVTIRSEGADPSDPTICIRTSRGNTYRLMYNFYISSSLSDRDIRSGMAGLYPLAVGSNAQFFYMDTGSRSGLQHQYQDTFRVVREENLSIDNRLRPAWVIERRSVGYAGNNFSGAETLWFDQQTGITLKREIGGVTGTTSSRSFTVSQITIIP